MHIITAISARQGFAETCIRARHSAAAQRLPQLHGDPFDCLLMMQAEVDRMLFLSTDSQIMLYQKDHVHGSQGTGSGQWPLAGNSSRLS